MTNSLDRRLHPVRPDLAPSAYKGQVEAERFVDGTVRQIIVDQVDIRPKPQLDALVDTQGLFGERVTVFEETPEGWAWGQLHTDGYVGWFSSDALGEVLKPTHRVRALRTYRYPGADLKFPPKDQISIGSLVTVTGTQITRGLEYALLSDGSAVVAKHLVPLDHREDDWVSVAEELIGTPYLWAGRSSLGLDCSALVQLAAQTAGINLLRDSDMQEAEAGELLANPDMDNLQRGDLIFWRGHVAIVQNRETILHANGYTMTVAIENTRSALERIAATEWGAVTAVRRL